MSEPKPFASLSPTLLARKGGAKPAMRPQIQPLREFHENAARQMEDDLGWNDMGEPLSHDLVADRPDPAATLTPADVVPIKGFDAQPDGPADKPEVVRQQEAIVHSIADAARAATVSGRKSALDRGRRAAFTLRLDGDRHLRLRLASTLSNRSAQQLLTEALDRLLEDMPDVESLASRVRNKR